MDVSLLRIGVQFFTTCAILLCTRNPIPSSCLIIFIRYRIAYAHRKSTFALFTLMKHTNVPCSNGHTFTQIKCSYLLYLTGFAEVSIVS